MLGALFAFAMPRGSGKTSLARHTALWAVSYGLRRYVYLIGANAEKANDSLAAIKSYLRFLPLYGEDFPEIAHAVHKLQGIAHRAQGQHCQGQPTLIEWSKERVTLPTVPCPPNWPRSWPRRSDGMAPTSGAVVSAAGLTSDGIRGSLLTLTTGESVRPDLVLLDDPQTPESSRSPAQNATREQLIAADVLGMAGPGKTISAVMPCTVISRGDMIDNLLDRSKHPLWRGERTKLLRSMPTNMDAWERYFDVYRTCAQAEPPNYAEAHAYYRDHRDELEAGADISWPERKLDSEVSALQHAMHLYVRDRRAFAAEYQNDPLPDITQSVGDLTADEVCQRLSRLARGLVPVEATRLTAFIDVQATVLFYVVVAWAEEFSGWVVDYGSFPRQNRAYWTLSQVNPTLATAVRAAGLEGQIYGGLEALAGEILGKPWPRAAGGESRVDRCFIDANWGQSTDVVYQFCRQSAFSVILTPSHGKFVGASSQPLNARKQNPGDRVGLHWFSPVVQKRGIRHCVYDTNWWKSFTRERLKVAAGDKGGLWLWGESPDHHRMLADHLVAEYHVQVEGRGRTVDEWKLRPERPDNHWWDCLVGAAVAASMQGASLPDLPGLAGPKKRRYVPLGDMRR